MCGLGGYDWRLVLRFAGALLVAAFLVERAAVPDLVAGVFLTERLPADALRLPCAAGLGAVVRSSAALTVSAADSAASAFVSLLCCLSRRFRCSASSFSASRRSSRASRASLFARFVCLASRRARRSATPSEDLRRLCS